MDNTAGQTRVAAAEPLIGNVLINYRDQASEIERLLHRLETFTERVVGYSPPHEPSPQHPDAPVQTQGLIAAFSTIWEGTTPQLRRCHNLIDALNETI